MSTIERVYLIDGILCEKELEVMIGDVKLSVFYQVKHHCVFFNDHFVFKFQTSTRLVGQELLDLVLETTIEKWGIPKDAREYSLFYCGVGHPNGEILNQHEEAMECKKRLKKAVNQDFIDSIKVLEKITSSI